MQPITSILLLCADTQARPMIERVFTKYATNTEVCLSASEGLSALQERQFDLLVLDLDVPEAADLLQQRVRTPWRYPSVAVALISHAQTLNTETKRRVHLVLQKPFTPGCVERTLKVAHSLVVKDRRAAFRHAVQIPASGSIMEEGAHRTLRDAVIQDISYTGMCLKSNAIPSQGATVSVYFQLPDSSDRIHVLGKVMWTDPRGRVGIHFEQIPATEFHKLQSWLEAKCPWDVELPLAAASLAARFRPETSSLQ